MRIVGQKRLARHRLGAVHGPERLARVAGRGRDEEAGDRAGDDVLAQRAEFVAQRVQGHSAPEAPRGERILPMPIGQILYEKYGHGQPLPPLNDASICRFFPETGFYVCLDFLIFYEAHGGEAFFGLPNFERQDGKIVQYFRNARLEWHANLPAGHRVVVSNLGLEYFHQFGGDLSKLMAPDQNATIDVSKISDASKITIKTQAYTQFAVLPLGKPQTLFVLVYNQQLLPVEGVQISFQVTFPSGQEHNYIIPSLTNAQGITSFTFPTVDEIGEVIITVNASIGISSTKTTTSFHIWW